MCYYWLLFVLSSGGGKISSGGSQTPKIAILGGVKYKLFKIKLSPPNRQPTTPIFHLIFYHSELIERGSFPNFEMQFW
jgi:hypothetical protein